MDIRLRLLALMFSSTLAAANAAPDPARQPEPNDMAAVSDPVYDPRFVQAALERLGYPNDAVIAALRAAGMEMKPDRSLVELSDSLRLRPEDLFAGWIFFDRDGNAMLVGRDEPEELRGDLLARTFKSLFARKRAIATSPAKAGAALRAWGMPQAADGLRLLDPNGDATYYGRYLYESMKDTPPRNKVSADRINGTIYDMFTHLDADWRGYGAALEDPAAAAADASGTAPKPLLAQLQESDIRSLKGVRARATYGALAKLGRTRYNLSLDTPWDPPLPIASGGAPPSQAILPGLLKRVSQMIGKPLTDGQKRALIESFPMGEYITRTGAYKLWDKGLDGRGIKIAIIDTGIAPGVSELAGRVGKREDLFPEEPYDPQRDTHGVSSGYTAVALAPGVTLNSYRKFAMDTKSGKATDHLEEAIDRAVADGNQIINMSLGGRQDDPALDKKIAEYSRRGIVFIVAAGNSGKDFSETGGKNAGIDFPSMAASVLSAGALGADGGMAAFSSYGSFPVSPSEERPYKTLFMAPGSRVAALASAGAADPHRYELEQGTSLAAPAIAGIVAMLAQQALAEGLAPVKLNEFIAGILAKTSTPLKPDQLPSAFPIYRQQALVVDPAAASQAIDLALKK